MYGRQAVLIKHTSSLSTWKPAWRTVTEAISGSKWIGCSKQPTERNTAKAEFVLSMDRKDWEGISEVNILSSTRRENACSGCHFCSRFQDRIGVQFYLIMSGRLREKKRFCRPSKTENMFTFLIWKVIGTETFLFKIHICSALIENNVKRKSGFIL